MSSSTTSSSGAASTRPTIYLYYEGRNHYDWLKPKTGKQIIINQAGRVLNFNLMDDVEYVKSEQTGNCLFEALAKSLNNIANDQVVPLNMIDSSRPGYMQGRKIIGGEAELRKIMATWLEEHSTYPRIFLVPEIYFHAFFHPVGMYVSFKDYLFRNFAPQEIPEAVTSDFKDWDTLNEKQRLTTYINYISTSKMWGDNVQLQVASFMYNCNIKTIQKEKYSGETVGHYYSVFSEYAPVPMLDKSLADSLYKIYMSQHVFPKWSIDSVYDNPELLMDVNVYHDQSIPHADIEDLRILMNVVTEREPVHFRGKTHRRYGLADLTKTFGWKTGYYGVYYDEHNGTLAPNIGVYTKAKVPTADVNVSPTQEKVDPTKLEDIHIFNAIGYAFDNKSQPDFKFFFPAGKDVPKYEQLKKAYVRLFNRIYKCASDKQLTTVVMSLVGADPLVAKLYKSNVASSTQEGVIPLLNEIWIPALETVQALYGSITTIFMDIVTSQTTTTLSDQELESLLSRNDVRNIVQSKLNVHFITGTTFPDIVTQARELTTTLFVNAWNPWSLPGNGNANDPTLDGHMGRCTTIALTGSFMTNPCLTPDSFVAVDDSFVTKASTPSSSTPAQSPAPAPAPAPDPASAPTPAPAPSPAATSTKLVPGPATQPPAKPAVDVVKGFVDAYPDPYAKCMLSKQLRKNHQTYTKVILDHTGRDLSKQGQVTQSNHYKRIAMVKNKFVLKSFENKQDENFEATLTRVEIMDKNYGMIKDIRACASQQIAKLYDIGDKPLKNELNYKEYNKYVLRATAIATMKEESKTIGWGRRIMYNDDSERDTYAVFICYDDDDNTNVQNPT